MGTGSSQQFDMGHWVLRLIALIIDSIILGIVAWILLSFALVSLLFSGALYSFWLGYGYSLVFPFAVGILEVLYFVIFEVYGGATIGKRILGLQVQMTNGDKIPFDKAFVRNISKIYWIFILLDWLVAIVTTGADRHHPPSLSHTIL